MTDINTVQQLVTCLSQCIGDGFDSAENIAAYEAGTALIEQMKREAAQPPVGYLKPDGHTFVPAADIADGFVKIREGFQPLVYATPQPHPEAAPSAEAQHLIEWYEEAGGFNQGTKAPHKWVLQVVSELRRLIEPPAPAPVVQPQEGWVMVPREPTPEMLEQIRWVDEITDMAMTARYRAMLAASPQPAPAEASDKPQDDHSTRASGVCASTPPAPEDGDIAKLREAHAAMPLVRWTKTRSVVDIPETEEWAAIRVECRANKNISPKAARYIAACNPVAIGKLLAGAPGSRSAAGAPRSDKHDSAPSDCAAPTLGASAPAGYKRGTRAQILLERELTASAIRGAMAFGYQGMNPPPEEDHWLTEFWKIGRDYGALAASPSVVPDTARPEPIETAPKDMRIMLFVPGFGAWNAAWWPGSWSWVRGQWSIHSPFSANGKGMVGVDIPQPTHWQPSPPAPEAITPDTGKEPS